MGSINFKSDTSVVIVDRRLVLRSSIAGNGDGFVTGTQGKLLVKGNQITKGDVMKSEPLRRLDERI